MTNIELAKSIRHGLFAERETLDEAWEYLDMVARGTKDHAGVITAAQVLINTLAKYIEKVEVVK